MNQGFYNGCYISIQGRDYSSREVEQSIRQGGIVTGGCIEHNWLAIGGNLCDMDMEPTGVSGLCIFDDQRLIKSILEDLNLVASKDLESQLKGRPLIFLSQRSKGIKGTTIGFTLD